MLQLASPWIANFVAVKDAAGSQELPKFDYLERQMVLEILS